MPDAPPNPELLRSLGGLVRGLSALFWGLPLALIICVGTGTAGWFTRAGALPAIAATGWLAFGLWQLGSFQKQERPWRNALDAAKLLALINFGLSPFLYWFNRVPSNRFFEVTVLILAISAWLFLFTMNLVIARLAAMLPDETLRHETKSFTALNRMLLAVLLVAVRPALGVNTQWLFWLTVCLLLLLPLAMTMALIWKTKEVIMDSVFGG